MPDERTQRPYRKLFVLRYRKIRPHIRLGHHDVASNLADDLPAGFLESLDRIFAGNVGEAGHAIRRTLGFQAGRCAEAARQLFDPQPTTTRQWLL